VVGASTGAFGAVWAQAELRKVLAAAGARVIDGEVVLGHAHHKMDERGVLLDDEVRGQLTEVLTDLCGAVHARQAAVAA
jgi:chromate reductase